MNEIVALELGALDRWGHGDPQGYLEIMAPEVTLPWVDRCGTSRRQPAGSHDDCQEHGDTRPPCSRARGPCEQRGLVDEAERIA
jgi:hypothetical protein